MTTVSTMRRIADSIKYDYRLCDAILLIGRVYNPKLVRIQHRQCKNRPTKGSSLCAIHKNFTGKKVGVFFKPYPGDQYNPQK